MKDAAKRPAHNTAQPQKKWIYGLLGLGVLGVISIIYLIISISKVAGYVSSINQLEVASSTLVRHVNQAIFSTPPQKGMSAQQQLPDDLITYQAALNQVQTYALDDPSIYQNLNQQWQMVKPEVESVINSGQVKDEVGDEQSTMPTLERQQSANKVSLFAAQTQQNLQQVDRSLLSRKIIIIPALLFLLSLLGSIYALYRLYQANNLTQRLLIEKETLRQRDEMDAQFERARAVQQENEQNQAAILRLLDELEHVADGDLTVSATVSEDITGAIADSVNYAIDQLRHLVQAINRTAFTVAESSSHTQLNVTELAQASELQSQKIGDVSSAINDMVLSIKQVSSNASQSTSVA